MAKKETPAGMENAVQTWTNEDLGSIRSITVDDEPWFVAKDVAATLGFGHTPHMVRLLEKDEKDVRNVDTPGGSQRVTVINESGLYHAIFQSRRDEAKTFRHWVTSEVLPAIRRTGTFGNAPQSAGLTAALQKLEELTDRISALEQASAKDTLPDMTDVRERVVALVRKAAKEHSCTDREAWFDLYSGYAKISGIPLFKCAKAMDMSVLSFIDIIGRMDSLRRFAEQLFWDVSWS